MKYLIILFLAFALAACSTGSENKITGKWLMDKVLQDGQDVSSEHNPFGERFLVLNTDSTFESGGRPYGSNTGTYLYMSEDNTLFLDSDAGPDDDSQWIVSIQGDSMHWQGYGSEWALAFEIVHRKDKQK